MRIIFIAFSILTLISSAYATTDVNDLRISLEESKNAVNTSLNAVRDNCVGISQDLDYLKTLAGIGTGVSTVGVAGATTAGIAGMVKQKSDEQAMEFGAKDLWNEIRDSSRKKFVHTELLQNQVAEYEAWFRTLKPANEDYKANIAQNKQSLRQSTEFGQKSKKMADLRTGTLAASAALNIAGAAVSGVNMKNSTTITERISNCLNATHELSKTLLQLQINKRAYDSEIADTLIVKDDIVSDTEINSVQNIIKVCNNWLTVDLSKIEKQAKAAVASNIVGAATSTTGIITSAISNTDANRLSGTNKEKGLNVTSNVMAAGSAAAGIAATIFNATQISKIKHAAAVAGECEGALK